MSKYKFDFDTVVDRRNTNCGRWDTMDKKYGNNQLIHLGVADMDFRVPKPITDGFQKCVDHGIFGYTDLNDAFYDSFIAWMKRMHHVEIHKEEIVFCPRINISSSLCVETFTEPEDAVMINTPAYGPLYDAIVKNHRTVLESRLVLENDRYKIDFEHLEETVTPDTKMFILCSPHNPVGRVFTKEELEQVGEFCLRHNLILYVDEIHGDITAKGVEFISTLSLKEEIRNLLVVAASPTKTFNIPGVILSYLVIPNSNLRQKIQDDINRIGMHNPTIFAVEAAEKAYTACDDWYEEVLSYINENEAYTRSFFASHMPQFHIYPREGTFLLWMDYSQLNCTEEELQKWFTEKAHVSVYMGTVFREEGRGYIRVNIASPRKLLQQAFEQMAAVYEELIVK